MSVKGQATVPARGLAFPAKRWRWLAQISELERRLEVATSENWGSVSSVHENSDLDSDVKMHFVFIDT